DYYCSSCADSNTLLF
nr:immunoglobulin light chain junction region [Macaca mulatta]MOX16966.1 immunoglobulin light chain junction region [Macaca mulatta]MOX17349.1 immunoglobulin light chain junction region [Macaca mulatta]MOX17691.1 immunoglobulin light chain junction region [Macaca mulatta]MOX18358.1 immunoglobulin light chain junction region [Macaca mulatta]